MSTPATGTPRTDTSPAPTLGDPPSRQFEVDEITVSGNEFNEVVRAVVDQEESRYRTDGPPHPMAHLMPERVKPTEAQIRAAELRATNKRKARRAKVLVVVAAIALGVFAGPPLAVWVVDAVNEPAATTDESNETPADTETNGGNSGVDDLLEDFDTPTNVAPDTSGADTADSGG